MAPLPESSRRSGGGTAQRLQIPGRFEGRTALVTGGGTGIGRGIALEFAQQGAKVVIAGIEVSHLEDTVKLLKELGGDALYVVMDQALEADCVRAVSETVAWSGQIDILVNNAAVVGQVAPVTELDTEEWEACFRVNLTGVMILCREAAKMMKSRKSGVIVNVSSNVSRRGFPDRAPYVCSKWGLNGLGQTLALELASHGIRVNTICPGPVLTDRLRKAVEKMAKWRGGTPEEILAEWESESPMGRLVTVEECAQVVLFLASDEASSMTGQALNVTAGAIMT